MSATAMLPREEMTMQQANTDHYNCTPNGVAFRTPVNAGYIPPIRAPAAAITAPQSYQEKTPASSKVYAAKLLNFSNALHLSYDTVETAWVQCKMDGYVMYQDECPQASKRSTGGDTTHAGSTSPPTAPVTGARLAGQKRSIQTKTTDSAPRKKTSRLRRNVRPKVVRCDEDAQNAEEDTADNDEDDEESYDGANEEESEYDPAEDEAEDEEQSERVKAAELRRQYVIEGDFIKLNHGVTKRRDVEWALDKLLKFASIAPGEPIAILRRVASDLRQKGDQHHHGGTVGPIRPELKDLNKAIDLWWDDENQNSTQAFLRAFNIAVVYRKITRKHHKKGKEDIEEHADELLKLRDLKDAYKLGLKVWTLAFAISDRNMIGVLLLRHFELNVSSIQDMSQNKMVALIGLLTSNHWTLEQMGISAKQAGIVEFITNRLIPGIEATLLENLRSEVDLLPSLCAIVNYEPRSKDKSSFGLNICKTWDTATKSEGPEIEAVVHMPPVYMIDGKFLTSDETRFEREYIISLCSNRVHLDSEILASKYHSPQRVSPEIFKGWQQYQEYFKIRGPPRGVSPFDVPPPKCSGMDDIDELEWESQNRYLTFWGTLLCKCPHHLHKNRRLFKPSVLGSLSAKALDKHSAHDKQVKAEYQVADVLREKSPGLEH